MSKDKRHIILKVTDDGLFYNEQHFFHWKQTNFPAKYDFAWREHYPIYWKVEMLNYDRDHKILDVYVENYNESDSTTFNKQAPKGDIKEIHFHRLRWSVLQTQLRSYLNSSFLYLQGDEADVSPQTLVKDVKSFRTPNSIDAHEIEKTKITDLLISIKVDIMDFKFKTGCVECIQFFQEIDESLLIRLYNDMLLPQFDHIKPYFKKYFKNSKVLVRGRAQLSDDSQWKVRCRSQQIELIDDDAIASIRRMVLKDKLSNPMVVSIDKSLFTSEDIFLDEQNVDLGKALGVNENDLLKEILNLKGVRNRKQLIYLSGKVQDEHAAIRFTLAPQFGFLFYTQGQEMSHFIWELINSHATYLWSGDLDTNLLTTQFKSVESIINSIRDHGRRAYLSDTHHEDFIFNRIPHQKANSTSMDPFPLWKARLDERLV
jgi:hypothetical protein